MENTAAVEDEIERDSSAALLKECDQGFRIREIAIEPRKPYFHIIRPRTQSTGKVKSKSYCYRYSLGKSVTSFHCFNVTEIEASCINARGIFLLISTS